jgi:hypothetical protein
LVDADAEAFQAGCRMPGPGRCGAEGQVGPWTLERWTVEVAAGLGTGCSVGGAGTVAPVVPRGYGSPPGRRRPLLGGYATMTRAKWWRWLLRMRWLRLRP